MPVRQRRKVTEEIKAFFWLIEMDFYVYVHKRATDGSVFYVGKGHKNRAYNKANRNRYWHNIVNKHGYLVEIIQSNMKECDAFDLEKNLISKYGRDRLCNLTDGGEGSSGYVPSLETRLKLAEKSKRKHSPESIEKTASAHRGSKRSDESKERMRIAQRIVAKRGVSDETRKKMSDSGKLRVISPDHRKNLSMALKGLKKSDEHRKKLSIAKLGKKMSETARMNMSIARKGIRPAQKTLDAAKKSRMKKVKCSNGMEFKSGAEAIAWLRENINPKAVSSEISVCARGLRNSCYGFKWEYLC